MPLIDTLDELAPDQILLTTLVFDRAEEVTTAVPVVVLGRRTTHPLLAVHPSVRTDGTYRDHCQITHIPTGITVVTGQYADRCHAIADVVADLDWAFITSPDSVTDEFRAAFRERMTRLDSEPHDQWEPDAADRWAKAQSGEPIPSKAVNLAGWALENAQEGWNRTIGDDHEHAVPPNLPDTKSDEYPHGAPNPLWMHWTMRTFDCFGIGFLLLVLRRVDPDVADNAAAWLAAQWEAGESVGEWTWDLAKIIAERRHDTANVPAAPPALGPLLA